MKKEGIIIASVILIVVASLVTFQFISAQNPEDQQPSPPPPLEEWPPDPPGYTPQLNDDKPILPPKPPIPREEWPPLPTPTHPPLSANLPPPEISGNVVKIGSREVLPDSTFYSRLLLFTEGPAPPYSDLVELQLDLRITFDPEVIRVDQIHSHARYIYDAKPDNVKGIIELSVDPRVLFRSGWTDLGFFYFTAVGNAGQFTDLDITITTPVENLTVIDGQIVIIP